MPDLLFSSDMPVLDKVDVETGSKKDLSHSMAEKDDIVSKVSGYRTTFISPPKMVPPRKTVDRPVIGNKDVGVVLSGSF
jgi:hypothetical protein